MGEQEGANISFRVLRLQILDLTYDPSRMKVLILAKNRVRTGLKST